jgi:hypothetical protein
MTDKAIDVDRGANLVTRFARDELGASTHYIETCARISASGLLQAVMAGFNSTATELRSNDRQAHSV